jgi:hypothetical protein
MTTTRRRARRFIAAVPALVLGVLAGSAFAEDDATRANHIAYDAAIKCFIANGILTGDEREKGDRAREAIFEAQARQSFEIAVKLGDALGYSGTRVNEDFGLAQTREMSKLMNNSAYFKSTAATCKALGLM